MKIAVMGYSGAGKSTFAEAVATQLDIPLLHMDKIGFLSNWKKRDEDEARQLAQVFMAQESWVMDGNWKQFYQKERLELADKIFFFNLPRLYCLKMVIKRSRENKGRVRSSMANGCIEKLDAEFLWWVLVQGRTRAAKKHYKSIVAQYRDKTVVFQSAKEVNSYLSALKADPNLR